MKPLLLVILVLTSIAAEAKSVRCPKGFIDMIEGANDYFRYSKDGMGNIFYDQFAAFEAEIAKDARIVNCRDEDNRTPLTAALSGREKLCARTGVALYLLEKGVDVNQTESYLDQPALFYAIESYGYTWGKPTIQGVERPELVRDMCRDESPEADLRSIIKQLIAKGAKTKRTSKHGTSIAETIRDSGVPNILSLE